ncbi:MAG: alpha/beta fold hydrolase [Flavobacteriaceae bacterium]|nr:alpha/beta fold hydrolase [Flavobacteriaceae bacterium]
MKKINLKITNRKGHQLNAFLELPANQKPNFYAIFAHCFTCSATLGAVKHISRALTTHGFGVVRFDFTGLGKSEGEFADSHFSGNVNDLLDVNSYLSEHYQEAQLLVGHSLGGAAVLVAATRLPNVKAVATINAPAEISHVKKHFSPVVNKISNQEETEINIGGRPFTVNQDFLADFEKTELLKEVKTLRKSILIMHSPIDKIVGIENAERLYLAAHHPKSFVSLNDADHLLTDPQDSLYIGGVIGAWALRYFPKTDFEMLETEGEQLVAHLDLDEDNFTTQIQTKKHHFIVDEPESFGGDNFGPTPYDYLSGALAACTAMTLKIYSERKKWDLEEVYVYVSYSKKHSDDLSVKLEKPIQLDFMLKKLKLIGNLDAAQKEKLVEIASKCPVHKSLASQMHFKTQLIDD